SVSMTGLGRAAEDRATRPSRSGATGTWCWPVAPATPIAGQPLVAAGPQARRPSIVAQLGGHSHGASRSIPEDEWTKGAQRPMGDVAARRLSGDPARGPAATGPAAGGGRVRQGNQPPTGPSGDL